MTDYRETGIEEEFFSNQLQSSDYRAKTRSAFPLRGLTAAIAVTLLLLGFVGIEVWTNHHNIKKLAVKQLKTQRLIDRIVYLDEVLTMSARMGAVTGDTQWEQRYLNFEPNLNAAIKALITEIPEVDSPAKVDQANNRLVQLEKQSFSLIRSGQRDQAANLLFGAEYESNKHIYAEHIQRTAEAAVNHIKANLDALDATTTKVSLSMALGVSILVVVWPCVLIQAKRHIAERRQAEENIRDINRQLERSIEHTNQLARKATTASQTKSDFLANMSHEIRTPMNAIVGFAEVLADENLTPEQRDHVNIIKESARNLLKTINDILDISKIEAGKLTTEIADCRLDRLLNSIESMMHPQADAKNLEFRVSMSSSLPKQIRTDAIRLRQCLINLTSNAVKFTKQGYVYVNVNLQNDNGRPFIRFDVEDSGTGIAPEEQQSIFESFVQARSNKAGSFEGTGLGLTITRHLAELLGGTLSVTSQEDKGSVFSLVIPAGVDMNSQQDTEASTTENAEPYDQTDLENVNFSGRVLVAEDTLTNQMLIKLLLEKIGFEVTIVSDGREAVRKGIGEQFDLIFMDIHMPNMNGYEATRELRKGGVATPIIALTANAMKGDDRKCLAAGCNDYLPKPIDRKWLLCVLQKYLDPVNLAADGTTTAP
ncbi:MAG: response regulator [Sedimentisphaerales bacterium]|nr:response regulator [Sedimentisphaerales bacterium]